MAEVIGYVFAVFFFNGLLSLLVAYVAGQKGRSAAGFFWLSFFTSFLIGILVAIAVPRVERSAPNQAASHTGRVAPTSSGISVKCPFCAEWVSSEAKVCKHCGREIADEVAVSLEAEREAEEKARVAEFARAAEAQAAAGAVEEERARSRTEFRASKRFKLLVAIAAVLTIIPVSGLGYKLFQWASYQPAVEAIISVPGSHSRTVDMGSSAAEKCNVPRDSYTFRSSQPMSTTFSFMFVETAGLSTRQLDCLTLEMRGVELSFWIFGLDNHDFPENEDGEGYSLWTTPGELAFGWSD
jgi:hypothetical protein